MAIDMENPYVNPCACEPFGGVLVKLCSRDEGHLRMGDSKVLILYSVSPRNSDM